MPPPLALLYSGIGILAAITWVIWGEKDGFVPRSHGETYAKLIPNSGELKVIAGAGHSAHVEKPAETAKLVADFLAK